MKKHTVQLLTATCASSLVLSACADNFIKKESPAKAYKDYSYENRNNAAVLGVGEPMSVRQMRADATFNFSGTQDLEGVMKHLATTYNVAVRWGNGVRKGKRKEILINQLSFDEARAYIEDVYDVQVIREGERRLLVLPSASETRLTEFNPGTNVTLASALSGLAEQCGYNLVITESREMLATTRVTTKLKDVTCIDAFEALLTPQRLSLVNTGDYYTIGGLPQRQWTVNLYEPQRTEKIGVKYASDISSGDGGEDGGGSSGSAGGSSDITITYERDLWKDLQDDLQELIDNTCQSSNTNNVATSSSALLPPPDSEGGASESSAQSTITPSVDSASSSSSSSNGVCGYVRINKNVGLVQMRAAGSVLEEANDIITRTEEIATRRIMLEARVLAVSKNRDYNQDGRIVGMQGDKFAGFNDNKTNIGSLSSPNQSATTSSIATSLAEFLNNSGGSGSASAGVGSGGFIGVGNRTLQAAVQFLESFGTTYELMHPRIELMDRQRATLIDGRNEKYFVLSSDSTSDGGSTTTSVDVEERSQFLGLQFSASAQVGDAGEPHTVSLQIPITSLVKTVTIPNSNGSTAPVASTRMIDQQVRLRDGEIKVIGGLTKTIAIDRESGIPIFREVPVAGKLGSQENVTYENVEFVVLLQVKRLD